MGIVARVAEAMQRLFGSYADEVARTCKVIQRRRKFAPASLAQTFVLGFLAKPNANDEELAQTAALCGVEVSPQAVEQRYTPRLVAFLQGLFGKAMQEIVRSQRSLAPLLERFIQVVLLDSTTIVLPAELAAEFPGCGGGRGGGEAAVKFQTHFDLRRGALTAIDTEPGRVCDAQSAAQSRHLPPGSLRISDLGYFDTEVFGRLASQGVFWLSRLLFGTAVFTPQGQRLSVLDWLAGQPGRLIDEPIRLGAHHRVECRLVAWRIPEEVANRRRQKLIAATRAKNGCMPSAERLAFCDWTILVTNVPNDRLSPREMAVLSRARWQVELLFKRWKSLGLVAQLSGSVTRQLVQLWSRLLAVVLQQWLLIGSVWGELHGSLVKASRALQRHAVLLMAALDSRDALIAVIERLGGLIRKTARQNKRKSPSTFELLNDPARLGYSLT
jgi:hypothetical protein